jgi:hypothetical protein
MNPYGDFIARTEIAYQHAREREASGWVFVTTDDEFDTLVHVVGPFPTAEEALVAAGRQANEDKKLHDEDEAGWTHTVLPLFAPDEPK